VGSGLQTVHKFRNIQKRSKSQKYKVWLASFDSYLILPFEIQKASCANKIYIHIHDVCNSYENRRENRLKSIEMKTATGKIIMMVAIAEEQRPSPRDGVTPCPMRFRLSL
jgi:hypothetical protein